jgi:hypothetical protein
VILYVNVDCQEPIAKIQFVPNLKGKDGIKAAIAERQLFGAGLDRRRGARWALRDHRRGGLDCHDCLQSRLIGTCSCTNIEDRIAAIESLCNCRRSGDRFVAGGNTIVRFRRKASSLRFRLLCQLRVRWLQEHSTRPWR